MNEVKTQLQALLDSQSSFGESLKEVTAGIWIGNVNSDRKSFKESLKEVKAEQRSFGESLKEVKAEQRSFGESLKEVKAEQRSFGESLKEVRAEQRSFGESLREVRAEQRSFGKSLKEVKAEQRSFGKSLKEVRAEQRSFGKSMKEVKTNQTAFWQSMKQVEEKISNIPEHLPLPAVVEAQSPLQLSKFGKKISDNLSVDKWAADHALCLVDKASEKQEFEIFEMCMEYVGDQFDNDLNFNRNFRKGAYEVGTDVEQVKKVYAVELRDALLALLDA